jgi:hypothetical protein
MPRRSFHHLLCIALLVTGCGSSSDRPGGSAIAASGGAEPAPPPAPLRNPFGLDFDVPDPLGDDVRAFAETVKLDAGPDDPNAEAWVEVDPTATWDSIEGPWAGRWNSSEEGWRSGLADIRIEGESIFIRFQDDVRYLIEARREGPDRLLGRYVNVDAPIDTSPWVGRIVGHDRIDGQWNDGRWDFRRGTPVGQAAAAPDPNPPAAAD